jgi:ubiquinone/menaquinone biosynthesis C-methylase UbiE
MKYRKYLIFLAVLAFLTLSFSHVASAQLASRPAEDWVKTLDADSRVSGLKIEEIVSNLKLKHGQNIADIGAGSGLFEVPLAKAVTPGGKVFAVDIDAGLFPEIMRKAQQGHVNNVQTVLGKFTDPNLPAKNIDLVFFHDVLHHIEDRAGYLKTVAGYLKTSGRIVVIDFEPEHSPHKDHPDLVVSREQLATWAAGAGLKQVDDIKIFSDKYFLVYSK